LAGGVTCGSLAASDVVFVGQSVRFLQSMPLDLQHLIARDDNALQAERCCSNKPSAYVQANED